MVDMDNVIHLPRSIRFTALRWFHIASGAGDPAAVFFHLPNGSNRLRKHQLG